MNEFEYITFRIGDLAQDSVLLKFQNSYRFNPDTDIVAKREGPGNKTRLFNNKWQLNIGSLIRNSDGTKIENAVSRLPIKMLDHSWEPIEPKLDSVFWEAIADDCKQEWGCDKLLILNSEHSSEINKLETQVFKPVHWFSHGYLCSEHWYRNYKDIKLVTEYRPIDYAWVCTNRLIDSKKVYRIQFLNMLDISRGAYSLPERDPVSNKSPNEIYSLNTVTSNQFDDGSNSSAWIDFRTPTPITTSFLHVVTETVIDRVHLTEKILKPIVLKQPFVLVGGAGCLQYLQDYGFTTFNRWWSEDYDNIQDPIQRMQAVAEIVNWIGKQDRLESLRNQMKEVLDYNYHWFYNGFSSRCWDELVKNVAHHQTHK